MSGRSISDEIESHAASGDTRAQSNWRASWPKQATTKERVLGLSVRLNREIAQLHALGRSSPFARAIRCAARRSLIRAAAAAAMDAPRTSQHSWRLPAFANHRAGPPRSSSY